MIWRTIDDHLATYSAAAMEAARLRHGEIDTDHLLLGVLAEGGEPARRLAAQGVTLGAAREACVRLQRDDLGALGIDVPDVVDESVSAADLTECVAGLRLAPDADRLLSRRSDDDLLARLLGDARVRRLVEECGGDPDALAVAGRRPSSTVGRDELLVEQWVAAEPAKVFDLLADPRAMVRWNNGLREARVDEDGVVHGEQAGGWTGNRRAAARWTKTLQTPLTEGRGAIAWRLDVGDASMVDLYEVEADGSGSLVRLRRERSARGLLGRLAARLSRLGMRHSLLGLARAAA